MADSPGQAEFYQVRFKHSESRLSSISLRDMYERWRFFMTFVMIP
jgi:hypothetical protein